MLVGSYDTLLVIMAIAIISFAVYAVKKLYQGQR
jgi:flagellar biogenesis protein FliO